MFYKLYSIAKNTFVETIRQPVYAIIIAAAVLLFIISPSLTMYSLDDDNKLLREIGLSTLFIAGLFISIFSASTAITEEFDTKTIITTLSKPIPRFLFILGKFTGVLVAVFIAHLILTISLLMAIRHGVMTTASDTHDFTVIVCCAVSIGLTLLITAFLNYSYDFKFTSTAVNLLAVFSLISITFLFFIDKEWKFYPAKNGFHLIDVYASALLLFGLTIITAAAIMFSTRFNILITLSCCIGLFLLGLVSDYIFGRLADSYIWAKLGKIIIPSLQVFWISDAIYEEGVKITYNYIMACGLYGVIYSAAFLFVAVAMFQRRQIG